VPDYIRSTALSFNIGLFRVDDALLLFCRTM
jgi:hypothetical protein